jgi:hypothetical protein
MHLIEWRVTRVALERNLQQTPQRQDYKEIIAEHNEFRPSILKSMQENSEDLAQHLYSILRLQWSDDIEDHEDQQDIFDPAIYLTDQEILEYDTQHDLPVTISIDGSHEMDGVTTATISIVALDIRDIDSPTSTEWQNRIARVLFIRSWQLPKYWGTGHSSMNMAEAIGFLLGEYTISSTIPIIYVTDSNNA